MAEFAIVGFYLGINALLVLWLSAKVIGVRRAEQISIGDGGNKMLSYFQRGHGNAVENIPIFFLMLGVAALLNTPPIALHVLGVLFTLGRILHGYWFTHPSDDIKTRFVGMLLTLISMAVLALGLIAHSAVIMAGGY
ncbi:MAG: MAPEG family protein [Hyphomicrobiales bacterium]